LNVWELIIQQPVVNFLIILSHYLGGVYGLAIIALTIIINLAMLPMTLSQIRSTKAMQELQPRLSELQKKFGKDRNKLAQEQMKLYKESGVKPAGCLLTMIIQMPVWIALYQSIYLTMAVAPEGLLSLSRFLYHTDVVFQALPLSRSFLGLDLANGNIIMAVLVAGSQWVQQKMTMTPQTDAKQAQQAQMMLWMMPMMFGVLALSFPAGLSLYWVVNSLFRIVLQYRLSGWGGMRRQPKATTDAEKKYLKFDASAGKKPADESIPTAPGPSLDATQLDKNQLKPGKTRFQPGKDRQQKRPRR
jgi:YidC/Oxa1 family membrane protein insertase